MITHKSKKREIEDLQRLLVAAGYITKLKESERGRWTKRTQKAVRAVYRGLGWNHPEDGRWITGPALAAIAAASHDHAVARGMSRSSTGRGAAGPGTHAGGPGTHAGGPGTHAGGPGTHAG
ncbi:MAG: hypothetical protein AB8G26_11310 [Ilumatobacter sp.]